MTRICLGLPLAWARRLAEKGLDGEERGELVVGVVSTAIAIVGLGLALARRDGMNLLFRHDAASVTFSAAVGRGLVVLLAAIGSTAGIAVALLARQRTNARRAFVREVEAGAIEGFRVDTTPEGKVLVRVMPMGQGYRVANFEEPLYMFAEPPTSAPDAVATTAPDAREAR